MLYLFILENSTNFYWILEPTQSFYLHGKENSSKFWSFPVSSGWLVIILEKSYNQINTLFTTTYLPSMSPISGSAETK